MKDEELLDWVEFVATKFDIGEGWKYSRDLGGLKHLRYKSDYTKYNHWLRRLGRAFRVHKLRLSWWDRFGISLRDKIDYQIARMKLEFYKDDHLPDGQVNGGNILTRWEEDGEYITLMGPTVGALVVAFLRSQLEYKFEDNRNPHAVAILKEMHRVAELSWPDEKGE